MVSEDFESLMEKIYLEELRVVAAEVRVERIEEGFAQKIEIELRKDALTGHFHSVNDDVLEYVLHLQNIVDSTGEVKLTPVRDLGRNYADLEHLVDQDGSKLRAALAELRGGDLTSSPTILMYCSKRCAGQSAPWYSLYAPLKRDYHRSLAYYLIHSQRMLETRPELIRKTPHSKKLVDAIEEIMSSFRATGNPIKDFVTYRTYADFDLGGLARRIESQSEVIDRTIRDLLEKVAVSHEDAISPLTGDLQDRSRSHGASPQRDSCRSRDAPWR